MCSADGVYPDSASGFQAMEAWTLLAEPAECCTGQTVRTVDLPGHGAAERSHGTLFRQTEPFL